MSRFLLYLCLLLPLTTAQGAKVPGPPATEAKAVDYLASGIEALGRTLYVYKDFADGFNNFTEKVWIGDSGNDIPKMDEVA
ncbi:MAG: hypothetical protein LBH14_06350, partial [Desulfobulbaceae bacterium]|nr:hypothetical protein [Desulfobulbaceae bacterium]